jgi:hypothetical protein
MDDLRVSAATEQGLQNLSPRDKQELQQFVTNETQKAQIQSSMYQCLSCVESKADFECQLSIN